MCFKTKEGKTILQSRKYAYAYSMGRLLYFKGKAPSHLEVVVKLTNTKGEILVRLFDRTNNVLVKELNNPSSGEYKIPLNDGISYRIEVELHSACGGYTISY